MSSSPHHDAAVAVWTNASVHEALRLSFDHNRINRYDGLAEEAMQLLVVWGEYIDQSCDMLMFRECVR